MIAEGGQSVCTIYYLLKVQQRSVHGYSLLDLNLCDDFETQDKMSASLTAWHCQSLSH